MKVIVTGGTRGIGRGLAHELLQRGASVTITGRSQESVDEAVSGLGGDRVTGVAADMRDAEALQAVWDHAVATFGRVDAWVNNAGVSMARTPIFDADHDEMTAVVDINLLGSLFAAKVALAGMVAQGHGTFYVMEGFGSGGQTQPGMATYGATKRATSYLQKALRKDLGKDSPVAVGVLSPGIVVTDLLTADYATEEEWAKAKRIFDILGDRVETVTPYLADGIVAGKQSVKWLTGPKAGLRFALAPKYRNRDIFRAEDLPAF